MKKLLLYTAILVMLLMCISLGVSAEDTYINVGLFYGNSAKSAVTITNSSGTFTVNAADVAESVQYNSDGIISVDGKQYRGNIILKKDANGLLTVINNVELEDYIASVVSAEMSPSFKRSST